MKGGKGLILRLLPAFISLLCSGLLFYGAALAVQEMERQVPAAAEVYKRGGIGISMEEAVKFAADGSFAASGMGQEVSVRGGMSGSARNAWMEVTTSAYDEIAGLKFVRGGYFAHPESTGKSKYIVIPESLGTGLFGFDGGIGQNVQIADTEYTICGVYEEGGYLSKLGSGNIPVIYVNSFQGNKPGENMVNRLMLPADGNKTGGQLRQEAAIKLGKPIGGELLELDNLLELASCLIRAGLIMCLIWFVFRLFVCSNRHFLAAYDERENAARKRNHFIAAFIILAAALAGLGFLLGCIKLPASFLPEDNLFDLPYYAEMILDAMQRMNTRMIINDYLRISAVCLFAEVLLIVPAVILFWSGCRKIGRMKKTISES